MDESCSAAAGKSGGRQKSQGKSENKHSWEQGRRCVADAFFQEHETGWEIRLLGDSDSGNRTEGGERNGLVLEKSTGGTDGRGRSAVKGESVREEGIPLVQGFSSGRSCR